MKKNDKLIVVLGVVMLVLASVGVYYWTDDTALLEAIEVNDLTHVSGSYKEIPEAVSVSDECPFYALIATPLAVHYNAKCEQTVIPMYVENYEDTAEVIEELKQDSLYHYAVTDLVVGDMSAKDLSLEVAEKYWKDSEAALLIEYSEQGYGLGLNAVPLASYLGMPVIVTDDFDSEVTGVLSMLGVTKLLVCGENLEGYETSYSYIEFEDETEIAEFTSELVIDKFGDLDYITLANPIDAFPPEVLDEEKFAFGPETVESASMNSQSTIGYVLNYFTKKAVWEFTIPDDYKYALIEFTGYNHELDGVDAFGDTANFDISPSDGNSPTLGGPNTGNCEAKRDAKGNVIEDSVYVERLMYDFGGTSYTISAGGSWSALPGGEVSAKVVIKKLDSPLYEPMDGLSSVAPYLASYHKGIVFAKDDFAFTADDDVVTDSGETCPGYYLPGRNPVLVPIADRHIHDNVHEPINELLAKIADIDYEKDIDIEILRDHYKDSPVYIALVGGAVGLPQTTYQNLVEPIHDVDGDGEDDTAAYNFGAGGTQSDNIYGNIDPIKYDWSNTADDIYSDYPYMENIVGRITGYDVQDADALVLRTIFYDEIVNGLGNWKDTFGNLVGGGVDFRKPAWIETLNKIPGISHLLDFVNTMSGTLLNFAEGPWKYDTGFSKMSALATENVIGEELGFDVETALHEEAMLYGLSDDALDQLSKASFWNRLTFAEDQVKDLAGEGNVKGREILENSNIIWITGHGSIYNFGMDGPDLVNAGFEGLILNKPTFWQKILKNTISPHFVGGFWGPGGHLGKVGTYNTRAVSTVDFGPSFMWLESCFCGKILGTTPEANIGQSFIHSGVNGLIASTTGSNIPGGYLEPKNKMADRWWKVNKAEREWEAKAENGEYIDFHFGSKVFKDICYYLSEDDVSLGRAFRDAKNQYLPEDADWELWWSPPLSTMYYDSESSSHGGDAGYGTHIPAKYTTYHEFVLYGDPAFNPYDPMNS